MFLRSVWWGSRYKGFSTLSNLNYGLGLPKSRVEMIWAMVSTAIQVLAHQLAFLANREASSEEHSQNRWKPRELRGNSQGEEERGRERPGH